ncbi:MAG: hypothetical protein Q8N16_02390 [bacterium]|nr:hypothetical protein [bacterium]
MSQEAKVKTEDLLLKTPDVVNYSTKNYIEVQPGVMTPLVVNIKSTTKDFKVRRYLAEQLASLVSPESVCICGIESGANYYAAVVADILRKPLIFFRKESKEYGLGHRFVGSLPDAKGSLVTVIDDVIGEGKISTANVEELQAAGYNAEVCAIFSYLPQMKEFMTKLRIVYLSDLDGLCQAGLEKGIFNHKDVELIKRECAYSSK